MITAAGPVAFVKWESAAIDMMHGMQLASCRRSKRFRYVLSVKMRQDRRHTLQALKGLGAPYHDAALMRGLASLLSQYHDLVFDRACVHWCRPGAPVVLGNGDPVKTFKPVADKTGTRFSYTAHLPFDTHEEFQTNVTDSHSIVLFHYVTRSREEFVERKATMIGSGKYGMEFRNMTMAAEAGGPGANLSQAEMFADFEARHEFDKDDAICKQGAAIAEAAGLA